MWKFSKNNSITLVLTLTFSIGLLFAKDPGLNAFYKGDYKKSSDYYDARLSKDAENEKILYNRGTSALAEKDIETAESLLKRSLAAKDDSQLAKAYYNLGQIALQQEKTDEALDNFKKSMLHDSESPDAKIMYEHLQQMKQQQQQNSENKSQDSDDNSEDSKNESQEDKNKQNQGQSDDKQDQQQGDQEQEQGQQQNQETAQQQESQLSQDDLKGEELSKEQAKNILNAMKEGEKESMKKLILSKANSKKIKRSKEW